VRSPFEAKLINDCMFVEELSKWW